MPRSNFPLQMRMKAMRSRWALFILAWILNTNAEKSSRLGSMGPAEESPGRGGGERRRKSARNGSTPKFRERRAKEHRRQHAVAHLVQIEFIGRAVQQLDVLAESVVQRLRQQFVQAGSPSCASIFSACCWPTLPECWKARISFCCGRTRP